MRSAGIEDEEVTHYSRQQVAERLGVSINRLRQLCSDLRRVLSSKEFDFQPRDGAISAEAVSKLVEYRTQAKIRTHERILDDIKLKGL
jgi:hypothetical protein